MKLRRIFMLFCLISVVFVSPVYAFENSVIMGGQGPLDVSKNILISPNNTYQDMIEERFNNRVFIDTEYVIKNHFNGLYLPSVRTVKDNSVSCCSSMTEEYINKLNISKGEFKETPGEFQGPWGDLTEYVYQLSGNRRTKSIQLLSEVGKKPINENADNYDYSVDKWERKNGKGVVRYSQTSGNCKPEEWNNLSSGDSTFAASACGAYSTACVLSTMLGRYINVPEVALAVNTYELRHPDSDLVLCNSDGDGAGAFKHTDLAAVIEECGLRTEVADYFDIEKVDACLSQGGMVIYVVGSDYGGRYTYGSHYIVIREKTETGYLVYSSTNWANYYNDDYCNTENTANELKNLESSNGAQMVLVNY